jgi:hypothetical protein
MKKGKTQGMRFLTGHVQLKGGHKGEGQPSLLVEHMLKN